MTTHNPLVRINGKIVELPAADVIGGAPVGNNGTDGIDGGAITIRYTFDTTTTDADPGAGKLRLDNATQDSATKIYADLTDALGSDWTTVLDTFDDSTNTTKGSIRLVKSGDAATFLAFNVTALTSAVGYRKITVTNIASSASSPFANGDTILLCFDRAGDKGTDGADGTGDWEALSTVVTSSSQATITFSSIPSTHKDLRIVLQGRDTATGTGLTTPRMKINSDGTAANYTASQYFEVFGGSTAQGTDAATTNGCSLGQVPGSSGNANAVGMLDIVIPNYTGTTFHKTVKCHSFAVYSSTIYEMRAFAWKSTSAITQIDIRAGTTAFVDGTTATLYGLG